MSPFWATILALVVWPLALFAYLAWRDRHGHPRDRHAPGQTSDERYAEAAKRAAAKREAGR